MGYSLHKLNVAHSKIIVKIASFPEDLHMKGDTGYASLFYNFDACTMEKHTEYDMNMTTIFVPKEDWIGKTRNHLQFIFSLTGEDDILLSIPMFPGCVLHYQGFLPTHQQMHDGGKCTNNDCCLNYSAFANF